MGRYELSHLWSFFGCWGPRLLCRSKDPVWRELNSKGVLMIRRLRRYGDRVKLKMTTSKFCIKIYRKHCFFSSSWYSDTGAEKELFQANPPWPECKPLLLFSILIIIIRLFCFTKFFAVCLFCFSSSEEYVFFLLQHRRHRIQRSPLY